MAKFISQTNIKKQIQKLKKQRKKVVFTLGYFDIIHIGVINYFKASKKFGDVLFIALSSDKNFTNKNRPVLPLKDRIKIVSNMENIDYITVFDKIETLLKLLQPDVLSLGLDFNLNNSNKKLLEKYVGKIYNIKNIVSTETVIKNIQRKLKIKN
jgi:D-beta-D-heptose 7-phosphate kinase / D-beta-D-heptose 1-phosphate adenosyltransferase